MVMCCIVLHCAALCCKHPQNAKADTLAQQQTARRKLDGLAADPQGPNKRSGRVAMGGTGLHREKAAQGSIHPFPRSSKPCTRAGRETARDPLRYRSRAVSLPARPHELIAQKGLL